MDQELSDRRANLRRELDMVAKANQERAMQTHWSAIVLMIVAVAGSFVAGIAGLTSFLPAPWLGAIALIPGTASLAALRFKLQARSNWHYRKYDAVTALKSRLEYRLPLDFTDEDIGSIAAARDELIERMQLEWEKTMSFDWTDFKVQRHTGV
jgi:hypothetical protein